MVGVKLTARLVKDQGLGGKAIDRPDARRCRRAAGSRRRGDRRSRRGGRSHRARRRRRVVVAAARLIFHLAAIVSGEAEADFDKGYRVNLDGTRSCSRPSARPAAATSPRVVFTSSIAVLRRAVPGGDRGRVLPYPAHLLRHAEGDRRTPALRLHAPRLPRRHRHPPADDRRKAGQAEQGGVGLLLRHHPRAARRPGGDPAGAGNVRHWHASRLRRPRSASSSTLPKSTRPGSAIAAISICRVCPKPSLARSPRCARSRATRLQPVSAASPDPFIQKIVAGWAERLDARRALALGFVADRDFEAIIRVHIEDELGGHWIA